MVLMIMYQPFQLTELLARVRARLHEDQLENSSIIVLEDIEIDLSRQVIRRDFSLYDNHENAVLQYLIENKDRRSLVRSYWERSGDMLQRCRLDRR